VISNRNQETLFEPEGMSKLLRKPRGVSRKTQNLLSFPKMMLLLAEVPSAR